MVQKRATQESVNVMELPQHRAAEYVATYSNDVAIRTTPWDFRLLFHEITDDENGNLVREKKASVVMSPQQAAAFSQALSIAVERWKKEFSDLPNLPE